MLFKDLPSSLTFCGDQNDLSKVRIASHAMSRVNNRAQSRFSKDRSDEAPANLDEKQGSANSAICALVRAIGIGVTGLEGRASYPRPPVTP